jgi:hypothetical protein
MKALIPDRRQASARDMSAAQLILMFCFWVGVAWVLHYLVYPALDDLAAALF